MCSSVEARKMELSTHFFAKPKLSFSLSHMEHQAVNDLSVQEIQEVRPLVNNSNLQQPTTYLVTQNSPINTISCFKQNNAIRACTFAIAPSIAAYSIPITPAPTTIRFRGSSIGGQAQKMLVYQYKGELRAVPTREVENLIGIEDVATVARDWGFVGRPCATGDQYVLSSHLPLWPILITARLTTIIHN